MYINADSLRYRLIEQALIHPQINPETILFHLRLTIAFWFYLQMADERVLYRPRWLAEGQRAACKGQANSKQIAKSGSQSINNGISLRKKRTQNTFKMHSERTRNALGCYFDYVRKIFRNSV